MSPDPKSDLFSRVAQGLCRQTGHVTAFVLAFTVIVLWASTGPFFAFSNTWQLFINSFTTIVTFLMVFLIQNSQTRDNEAMQIKLDELLRVTKSANKELLDLEELSEQDLRTLQRKYERIAERARKGTKA